jgi:bifunctional DNA-binding transcriptional regulator/antitoxin component of YhaV-PrlF toxin-antitoxin module
MRKLIRVRDRNQITLPSEVLEHLGLGVGDFIQLDFTPAGTFELQPVQWVRMGTPEAEAQIQRSLEDLQEGRYQGFDSAAEYIADVRERRRQRKLAAQKKGSSRVEQARENLMR